MSDFTVSVHPMVCDDRETVEDVYEVSLPHQCDEWVVAWGDRHKTTVTLREFIGQAQVALAELEKLEPCPHQWHDEGKRDTNNAGTCGLFKCEHCKAVVWRVLDKSTAAPWFAAQYYANAPQT